MATENIKTQYFKSYDPCSDDISLLLTIINNRFLEECKKRITIEKQFEQSLQDNIKLKCIIEQLIKGQKCKIDSEVNLNTVSGTKYNEISQPNQIEENEKENDNGLSVNKKYNGDKYEDLLDNTLKPTFNVETFCPEINLDSNSHIENAFLEPWKINRSPLKNNNEIKLGQQSPVLNANFKKKKLQLSPNRDIPRKCEILIDSPQILKTSNKTLVGPSSNYNNILRKSPEKMRNILEEDTRKKLSPLSLRRSPKNVKCNNSFSDQVDKLKCGKVDDFKSPSILENQPNYYVLSPINDKVDNVNFFQFGKGQTASNDNSIINTSQNEVNSGFLTCEKQSIKRAIKKNFSQKNKNLKKLKQTKLTPKSFEQPTPKRHLRLDVTTFKLDQCETRSCFTEETFCDELTPRIDYPNPSKHSDVPTTSTKISIEEVINLDSEIILDEEQSNLPSKDVISADIIKSPNTRKRLSSIDADELLNEITSPDQKPLRKKKAKYERDTTTSFQYVREAVRKKSERQKLQGWDCDDCRKYYEGQNLNESELRQRMDKCSRHRNKFKPNQNETPPGFWNISFPETPEENKTQVGPPIRKKEAF